MLSFMVMMLQFDESHFGEKVSSGNDIFFFGYITKKYKYIAAVISNTVDRFLF